MQKFVGQYALISVLFFYSCGTIRKPQKVEPHLESYRWTLKELNGKKVYNMDGAVLYIEFSKADTTFHGNGGCNAMNGKYIMHDDLINLESIMHTERACGDGAINLQENQFFQLLEATEKFKIRGSKNALLELYQDKKLLAVFEQDSLR